MRLAVVLPGFLEELNSVRQHAQQDSTGPPWPTIVHCLAGAGRTGLLIMADVVKAELENNQVRLTSLDWDWTNSNNKKILSFRIFFLN